jgi:hypothetical protein
VNAPNPGLSDLPPPAPRQPDPYAEVRASTRVKVPWRDRLPELIAGIGTALVVAAVAGFVTSTWDELGMLHKAMALAGIAVGLTVAAVFVDNAARKGLSKVVSLVYLSASVTVAASATMFGYLTDPAAGRAGILAGGLAATVHAGWVLSRDRTSPTRVAALWAALLYASGPAGNSAADRFSTMDPLVLFHPVAGVLDPTFASDKFVVPGVGWTVTGVLLLALAHRIEGATRHWATTFATLSLFGAALMLNIASNPVGAFVALAIVVGYLVYGLVSEQQGMVVVGAVGIVAAGVRVVWGLFSGQIAVTVTALAVGLAMLGWAVHAARSRQDDTDVDEGAVGQL